MLLSSLGGMSWFGGDRVSVSVIGSCTRDGASGEADVGKKKREKVMIERDRTMGEARSLRRDRTGVPS